MIVLATIEKSGTFAVLRHLGWRDDGTGRQTAPISEAASNPQAEILNCHLTDENMAALIELSSRLPIYTTQRDPEAIRSTWIREGKDLAELDRQFANYEFLLTLKPFVVVLGGQ